MRPLTRHTPFDTLYSMPLLYYWRADNYTRDLDEGVAYHLNQASARLHSIPINESLWAFTRRADKTYVLAAELVVTAHTRNPANYRYGPYRVWGHLRRSRYFDTVHSPTAETVIRHTSLQPTAKALGRCFQGHAAVRTITSADDALLRAFAKNLPLEPRASLVNEEALERAWRDEDTRALERLVADQTVGLGTRRRAHLRASPRRRRTLVRQLRQLYGGRCQVCGWRPDTELEVTVCEGHHVQWLSRGGEDTMENLCLLCPNHHRIVHALDAPFDFEQTAFLLGGQRLLPLALKAHLLAPRA